EHFRFFQDFGNVSTVSSAGNGARDRDSARLRALLAKPIDDCGLSVRSVNSLKNSNISTLGDLRRNSEDEMLKVNNVVEKALSEIADLLRREGLNFGMQYEDVGGEILITNQGSAPSTSGGDRGVEV